MGMAERKDTRFHVAACQATPAPESGYESGYEAGYEAEYEAGYG